MLLGVDEKAGEAFAPPRHVRRSRVVGQVLEAEGLQLPRVRRQALGIEVGKIGGLRGVEIDLIRDGGTYQEFAATISYPPIRTPARRLGT